MPYQLLTSPHIALAHMVRCLLGRRDKGDADERDVLECVICGSHAVCPVDWWTEDEAGWMVHLRCGECDERWTLWLSNAQTARLEILLDEQLRLLADAADAADRDRMQDEADAFIEALRRDLIGPDDFAATHRTGTR